MRAVRPNSVATTTTVSRQRAPNPLSNSASAPSSPDSSCASRPTGPPSLAWVSQPSKASAAIRGPSSAAKLMAADDGPRIAALAFDGWDTHANEGGPVGRLAQLLSGLDGALAEFESGLGERWRDTAVVVATEFGRTARINGTEGTDHGTGTIALLAGGAVKGGRAIADWPGLKPASLYDARDLAPTNDLRAVIKGVLRDHLGLGERVLAEAVFPDSAPVKPMKGLVA